MERHLAAILAADVVGYSRLMGEDEAGTLSALKALRSELLLPKERQYHGRTVKLMGDGALMEFASVVDAVAFAVEAQVAMQARNAAAPEDRQIVYRIGINLGDIIVDGDDIYGDGVNVAARLEGLAEPGGICIARSVYDQVKDKLALSFDYLGEKQVKNIAAPVAVYRVVIDDKAAALATPLVTEAPPRRRWAATAAGLAVLALLGGSALWWQPWAPADLPATLTRAPLPLPEGPSIAVLPFANLSDDSEQEYFVDGMTDDLITDLSKIPGLFVISRNSSFAYKDRQVNVPQVARELGVRYVLEGSVRRAGDDIRINAQLIDASTGGHLWAERYDRRLDNVFAVQNAITGHIVEALELHLTEAEQAEREEAEETTSLEAYDLVLRARRLLARFDHDAAAQARDLLERAIALDPAYAEAHSLLGFYHFDEWRVWGRQREANLARALELGTTAAELSPADPAPHALLALVHQWRREFAAANAAVDKALALEPQEAITLSNIGSVLVYAGRGEEAVEAFEKAIRLDPFHPPNYLEWLGNAYWLAGDHQRCIEAAERGVALNPDYVSLHVVRAVCYAALGRQEKAAAAAEEILRTNPRFTLAAYAAYVPFTEEETLERRVRLLRAAGVPE